MEMETYLVNAAQEPVQFSTHKEKHIPHIPTLYSDSILYSDCIGRWNILEHLEIV